MLSIESLLQQLNAGDISSEALLKQCFEKIREEKGEGSRTFIRLFEQEAMTAACAVDKARHDGKALAPYAGVPISVKDLFDVRGSVTSAGSKALQKQLPAEQDAKVVERLRRAGFIIVGATNMTEFAYSGLGINPHYGTPLNPFERSVQRIPGGSSSGAAVAVSDGFVAASVGTDTGGSCRIPAALCGLVGFKPSAARIPRQGAYPLSTSLDCVGVLAASVTSCILLDAVMAGEECAVLENYPLKGLRLAVPQHLVLNAMDAHVTSRFSTELTRLRSLGVEVVELELPELEELACINRKGGFAAYESYLQHRDQLVQLGAQYDPRVRDRIEQGKTHSEADYLELKRAREAIKQQVARTMVGVDALLMPTVPVEAPTLASLKETDAYQTANALMLRNPSIANFLDFCSISLPCHKEGQAPVGVMLMARSSEDKKLLSIARAIENNISVR